MRVGSFLIILCLCISLASQAQSTASPNVSTFEIDAPQLDTIKKIWVYLPDSYSTSDKNYPVIYMHDAQNLFDKKTSYVGEWKVDEALDSIPDPEAIVIGIEHGGNKRIEELTPFPHENYGGGKADLYLDFIVNTLKPQVDTNFRTLTNTENTGIFGSSLGGLVSFYAGYKYPKTFGMIGVYSPSFWFSEKIFEFARKEPLNENTRLYFLVGTEESEEMVPDLKRMIRFLINKGLNSEKYKVKYVEGGKHNEAMWSENFTETYFWLMQK